MLLTSVIKPILYFALSMIQTNAINFDNKVIPESLHDEVVAALSYYPELYDTAIEFKFKENIKKSTMQAQPRFASFLKSKDKREYVIKISRQIQIDDEEFKITDIPSDVLIGWIGHELGHIVDYSDRTNFGMLIFGFNYLFSEKYIREVERTADTYAVAHGMGDYILKTKDFILENADISEKYKERIRRLYISTEEVMDLINEDRVEEEIEEIESE